MSRRGCPPHRGSQACDGLGRQRIVQLRKSCKTDAAREAHDRGLADSRLGRQRLRGLERSFRWVLRGYGWQSGGRSARADRDESGSARKRHRHRVRSSANHRTPAASAGVRVVNYSSAESSSSAIGRRLIVGWTFGGNEVFGQRIGHVYRLDQRQRHLLVALVMVDQHRRSGLSARDPERSRPADPR